MFRLRTVAVVCLAAAAVVTVAVREAPAGVAPSPSALPLRALPLRALPLRALPLRALPLRALIVALNGSDANPGTLAQPLATIQKAVNVVTLGGAIGPVARWPGGPVARCPESVHEWNRAGSASAASRGIVNAHIRTSIGEENP